MNIDAIKARSRIIRGIRQYFDEHGFIEVDTDVRIAAPAPEPFIDCPRVVKGGFLRASPELQMKKLLAAGMDKIYQIGPCFREGERGARHNPEFTMLEWYRRDATFMDIAADMSDLLDRLGLVKRGAISCITVREAYRRFAGWDPWDDEDEWDGDQFDYDMATKIEPALAPLGGVFLIGYPPACASLAKISGDTAERWEFYFNGIELANCFTELCDSAEQRSRFEGAREERRYIGQDDYPIDEDFLECLGAIPSAAGVALGIDRLVMALTGVSNISQIRCG